MKQLGRWRDLRFWRRQIACGHHVLETTGLVRAIAKRLGGGVPATAEGDGGASPKAKGIALGIDNLEVSFDSD